MYREALGDKLIQGYAKIIGNLYYGYERFVTGNKVKRSDADPQRLV
jgi:hypothetical protein